ncbi:MAG: tyrosinase family protein [Acidobacteriota bacterium]|nr:tyrosinase family protein [Acidobacteriota bacterium]
MLVTRRRFLARTGVATATLVGSSLLTPRWLFAAPPYLRRDVGLLPASGSVLSSYAKAIELMKGLPDTNPLSWTYQAAIHGSLTGSGIAWNTCEHGTDFFFSWHRMYLWYFERIVRKMSGNANWALPFWNYEKVAESALPKPFWSPPKPTNWLYESNRGLGWNDGTASLAPSAVATAGADGYTGFHEFSDHLEDTPHAAVHIAIQGLMGKITTAANDPIFWLHHANIDRLWNRWLAMGGGRSDPVTDSAWKTKKFTFFNEDGKQVELTGCDILRAKDQLQYSYQGEPPQVKEYCLNVPRIPHWVIERLFKLPIPPVIGPGPDPAPWEIDIREFRDRLSTMSRGEDPGLILELSNIEADRQPDVYYEVYVGLPAGETPLFESPHYVGNLALFGRGIRGEPAHGEFRPASATFRIDKALRATFAATKAADRLRVQFVARGAAQRGKAVPARGSATIKIGGAAIGVRRQEK